MRYIKTYEGFEFHSINEGRVTDYIKLLLSRGILPALIILQLSKMIGKEKAIDRVSDVIENYDGAELYKKEVASARDIAKEKCKKFSNKDFLIKKIDELPVRVGEIEDAGTTAKYIANDVRSVILLDSEMALNIKDLESKSDIITNRLAHEYMHYIDDLLGNEKKYPEWSHKNKDILLDIIDKDVTKEKIQDRLAFWMWNSTMDRIRGVKEVYDDIIGISDFIIKNKSYICSPEEIFVRVQGLRQYMVDIGILENINSSISEADIQKLVDYHRNNYEASFIQVKRADVLYLLALINIEDLSRKINKVATINVGGVRSDLT
jgi:predicted RNA-binding protein with EMAP domain